METTASSRRSIVVPVAVTLLAGALSACGDSPTEASSKQPVTVSFRVDGASPTLVSSVLASPPARVGGPLELVGSNGELTLDEILLIVNEVELHPADGSCDVVESSGADCPEFEAPPRLLDLPLDGEPVEAVTASIPAGAYKELDFEIEDLEDDEEEPSVAAAIAAIRAEVLAVVPDWPRKASGFVSGSFTPADGTPVPFRVFLEAEVEIEMELIPTLVIAGDGEASRELTVDIRPQVWFSGPEGTVLDLSQYDYGTTHELLDLEVEMEEGFTEIEIDG